MMNRSKSTLFLIEQLIVIAVFALCAAACISILANAYFMARDSRDISNALLAAESVADSFKAVSGDFEQTAQILGRAADHADDDNLIKLFFDSDWLSSSEADAQFVLQLIPDNHGSQAPALSINTLTVARITGDELVSFPVAVRQVIAHE